MVDTEPLPLWEGPLALGVPSPQSVSNVPGGDPVLVSGSRSGLSSHPVVSLVTQLQRSVLFWFVFK